MERTKAELAAGDIHDAVRLRGGAQAAMGDTMKSEERQPLHDPAKTREMVESAIKRTRAEFREDGTVELLHRVLAALREQRAAGFAVDERILADLEKYCGDNPMEAKT